MTDTHGSIVRSIAQEHFEVNTFYKDCIDLADLKRDGLARYAFMDAAAAERVHEVLMKNALDALDGPGDLPDHAYYTCTSCGYTFSTDEKPVLCPVCGAPRDIIFECPKD